MPRPLWTGSLSFGLVNIPVAMYSAVRDRGVRFHQLHEPDGSPVETHRVCAEEDVEVPWEEVVKGYELDDGRWVLLSDEDLDAALPARSHTVDIERFVRVGEIDPIYYERPYLLAPRDDGAARAYALLSQIMADSDRVALGRLVMRARERLVAIRARERALTLSTMLFHDELRPIEEIAGELGDGRPTSKQVQRAVAVIEELSVTFEPGRYHDEHRARLKKVIERKRKGQKIVLPSEPEPPVPTAPDLMGALEESLARIKGAKATRRRSASSTSPSRAQRGGSRAKGS